MNDTDKIINVIKTAYERAEKTGVFPFRICGQNGGDGHHYNLHVGGNAWGDGEIYISFTNHGELCLYNGKLGKLDVYVSEFDGLYAPKIRIY